MPSSKHVYGRKSRNDCEHFFWAGMIAEVNFLKIFGCCFFGDSYRIRVPSVNGIFGVFFQWNKRMELVIFHNAPIFHVWYYIPKTWDPKTRGNWRSLYPASYRSKPLYRRVQWFLGIYIYIWYIYIYITQGWFRPPTEKPGAISNKFLPDIPKHPLLKMAGLSIKEMLGNHPAPGNSAGALFGMVKWPF